MLDSITSGNTNFLEDDLGNVYANVVAQLRKLSDNERVATSIEQSDLEGLLNKVDTPGQSLTADEYFDEFIKHYIKHSINMASPRCLGHMTNSVPEYQRVISEVIFSLNQNLVKTEGSRVASIVERQVLGILHRKVYGFDTSFYETHLHNTTSVLGVVCSGATLANITALWCARNTYYTPRDDFTGIEYEGMARALEVYGHKRCVVLCSELVHYSIDKSADVLGLGTANVIKVPVDRNYRINMAELNKRLIECKARNWHVLAIIGVAGTTDCGSLDPIKEIVKISKSENIHLHVDAAWGTPLLFSPLRYELLSAIEQANTITLDGHKQLNLPIGTGMLMLRDPHAASTLAKQANYILRSDSGDLGTHSLEGSRPATALFLHAALHLHGTEEYSHLITNNIQRSCRMSKMISESPHFKLVMQPQTNIVVYLYIPEEQRKLRVWGKTDITLLNYINKNIQHEQQVRGMSFVSRTQLIVPDLSEQMPVVVLRAVLGNPETTDADLQAVLDEQVYIATQLNPLQGDQCPQAS